jgi:hypothetical protein
MIDAGGSGGGSHWQPPRLGNKKITTDERDQPDDQQKNEAHCARPPRVESSAFPTKALHQNPKIKK